MRTTIIRLLSMLGIVLVLFTALIAFLRFYPYNSNFSSYPKITPYKIWGRGRPSQSHLCWEQRSNHAKLSTSRVVDS